MSTDYTPTRDDLVKSLAYFGIFTHDEAGAAVDRFLATVRANPADEAQLEVAGQAVYDALPLHWDVRRRKDARKVSEDIARAVLTALAEAVGK